MNAVQRNLEQVWSQLRRQKPSRSDSLEEVALKGLRGIRDLRVPLPFPVTVLAGPNGCGKSTILFALACAYRVPEAGLREFTPAALFPGFRPLSDVERERFEGVLAEIEMTYSYVADNQRIQMKWSRGKNKWNRSFFGRKKAKQPERTAYLRTMAKLSNPSEVRSVLQMAQREFKPTDIDASNIAFAQRILSFRYRQLNVLTRGLRSILFAERGDTESSSRVRYSEFHMSAGERALLWLSIKISKLTNALVLIDEVEAGLHPYVQQMLMLELARLALRNQLQIVVTTHSPVILETVPPEGRVFLERTSDNVVRREAYRDIIQKALYGRSQNALSILCEDEEGEAIVRGFLDYLGPKIDFLQNDIEVGRDTGKDQFLAHLETLGRFRKLADIVFVVDGDGRNLGPQLEARAQQLGQVAKLVFLPGNDPPEVWVWQLLHAKLDQYAQLLGLTRDSLQSKLAEIDSLYANAADKPAAIAKNKLTTLAESVARSSPDILRATARSEAQSGLGQVAEVVNKLQDHINDWRSAER